MPRNDANRGEEVTQADLNDLWDDIERLIGRVCLLETEFVMLRALAKGGLAKIERGE